MPWFFLAHRLQNCDRDLQMADQLFLFNLIDGSPAVEVQPVYIPAPEPVPPVAIAPEPEPTPAETPWFGDLKLLDLVVILPFQTMGKDGTFDHGAFLKKPGVIVGFNKLAQMVEMDVGTPGNNYQASPWRVVKMND